MIYSLFYWNETVTKFICATVNSYLAKNISFSTRWIYSEIVYNSFDRSHSVVLFSIHKVFYSVTTQHHYIVNNT